MENKKTARIIIRAYYRTATITKRGEPLVL